MRKQVLCEACDVVFEIKHNMDEHWYSVKHYYPFCSAEINSADNEDDLYYEDDEDYN